MADNSQKKRARSTKLAKSIHARPAGYKGLAGFHKYWGKKPTEAWRLLIEHLTETDQIVLDPFLGSGLIAKECTDLGRRFIGFDVNPISIELTKLYLDLPSHQALSKALTAMEKKIKPAIHKMYLLADTQVATHFLWENEHITKVWTKVGRKRVELDLTCEELTKFQEAAIYRSTHMRDLRLFDNSRINSKAEFAITDLFTARALRSIDLLKAEIEQKFEGNIKRALLLVLSSSLGQMSKMVFAVTKRGKTMGRGKTMERGQTTGHPTENIEVGSWVIGYWRPAQHFEVNAWNCFENKARKLLKAIKHIGTQPPATITSNIAEFTKHHLDGCINVGDAERLMKELPAESVSVILTDPPHGDRIPYLELSEMWNSVLGLDSKFEEELVVSNAKERNKGIDSYNRKLAAIFGECARVLQKNGVLAVMFNARAEAHWDSLYKLEAATGLDYLGSYPLEYSAGSVAQDNRKGGLKTDLVLVYGKNMSPERKHAILNLFRTIYGAQWSTAFANSR